MVAAKWKNGQGKLKMFPEFFLAVLVSVPFILLLNFIEIWEMEVSSLGHLTLPASGFYFLPSSFSDSWYLWTSAVLLEICES